MTMSKFSQIFFRFFDIRSVVFRGMFFVLCLLVLLSKDAFAVDEEFLTYCVGDVFDKKYEDADCWSCDIIKILVKSMMDLTEKLFTPIRDLSILILQFGGAIWLALYLMKALGSLTAQDPSKVMDGILMFMFKWALIYAIIFAGMDTIMEYIVNPLLSIGLDVGMTLAGASSLSMI